MTTHRGGSKAGGLIRTIMGYTILALIILYLGAVGTFYTRQRSMVFLQDRTDVEPAVVGLSGARVHRLETSDGTQITSWSLAGPGPYTIIYFHGNGGSLAARGSRIRQLNDLGLSVLAIDYRGYGGSGGSPSETGLAADADAAYDFVRQAGVTPDRILLYGESLGSGVAVALAARRPVAGLILDAPFSSLVDVAADRYWMVPVRWLLRDPFRSDLLIGRIEAPIIILHGDQDAIVPIRYGRRLMALAGPRATFATIQGAGHTVLQEEPARVAVKAWLERIGAA